MGIQDWIIVSLVIACLVWAIVVMIRRRRSGKGCCGGCSGGCQGCRKKCCKERKEGREEKNF